MTMIDLEKRRQKEKALKALRDRLIAAGFPKDDCLDRDAYPVFPSVESLLRELGAIRNNEGLILVFDHKWLAGYTRYFDCGYPEPDRHGSHFGQGTTPELALANLYLTLHFKDVEVTDYGHDGK